MIEKNDEPKNTPGCNLELGYKLQSRFWPTFSVTAINISFFGPKITFLGTDSNYHFSCKNLRKKKEEVTLLINILISISKILASNTIILLIYIQDCWAYLAVSIGSPQEVNGSSGRAVKAALLVGGVSSLHVTHTGLQKLWQIHQTLKQRT